MTCSKVRKVYHKKYTGIAFSDCRGKAGQDLNWRIPQNVNAEAADECEFRVKRFPCFKNESIHLAVRKFRADRIRNLKQAVR